MDFLPGWKTKIAAIGLLLSGITMLIQDFQGNLQEGINLILAALAAFCSSPIAPA